MMLFLLILGENYRSGYYSSVEANNKINILAPKIYSLVVSHWNSGNETKQAQRSEWRK